MNFWFKIICESFILILVMGSLIKLVMWVILICEKGLMRCFKFFFIKEFCKLFRCVVMMGLLLSWVLYLCKMFCKFFNECVLYVLFIVFIVFKVSFWCCKSFLLEMSVFTFFVWLYIILYISMYLSVVIVEDFLFNEFNCLNVLKK